MRRLPVYVLLDTSGSMKGEPIQAVNSGLETMIVALCQDAFALETVHICIMTFDREAQVVTPLSPIDAIAIPHITTPESGPTHTGAALEALAHLYKQDIRQNTAGQKGDWAPYLFLMTDGKASDIQLFEDMCPKIRSLGFGGIIGCAAGPKARKEDLLKLCDQVVSLDTMDSTSFTGLFKWVSDVLATKNKSMGLVTETLPPPPAEIRLV